MATAWTYPFGAPVTPRPPSAAAPRPVFVLGAYPSAVHVAWTPPRGLGRPVKALPVADEPTPFWDGEGAAALVARWRAEVGFHGGWGRVELPGAELNGSSGRPIEPCYLAPLGFTRADAWITDCLDTHRSSVGVERAITTVYAPIAATLGLPPAHLGPHPSEHDIVGEATTLHAGRLVAELTACQPEVVITLGNAALRVLWSLPGVVPVRADAPRALRASDYGRSWPADVAGRPVTVWPLSHPAIVRNNAAYNAAHERWMQR